MAEVMIANPLPCSSSVQPAARSPSFMGKVGRLTANATKSLSTLIEEARVRPGPEDPPLLLVHEDDAGRFDVAVLTDPQREHAVRRVPAAPPALHHRPGAGVRSEVVARVVHGVTQAFRRR